MCIAPSIVSEVDLATIIAALIIVQWLPGAVGGGILHRGGSPVNMQFLHTFNFLKTMTLVTYYYDRYHPWGVSGVDLIELESEH